MESYLLRWASLMLVPADEISCSANPTTFKLFNCLAQTCEHQLLFIVTLLARIPLCLLNFIKAICLYHDLLVSAKIEFADVFGFIVIPFMYGCNIICGQVSILQRVHECGARVDFIWMESNKRTRSWVSSVRSAADTRTLSNKGGGYLQLKYFTSWWVPLCFPRWGSSHSTPSQSPFVFSTVPMNLTVARSLPTWMRVPMRRLSGMVLVWDMRARENTKKGGNPAAAALLNDGIYFKTRKNACVLCLQRTSMANEAV